MGPKKLKTADLDNLKPLSGASIRIPEFYQDNTVSINRTLAGGPILRTSIKAVYCSKISLYSCLVLFEKQEIFFVSNKVDPNSS